MRTAAEHITSWPFWDYSVSHLKAEKMSFINLTEKQTTKAILLHLFASDDRNLRHPAPLHIKNNFSWEEACFNAFGSEIIFGVLRREVFPHSMTSCKSEIENTVFWHPQAAGSPMSEAVSIFAWGQAQCPWFTYYCYLNSQMGELYWTEKGTHTPRRGELKNLLW